MAGCPQQASVHFPHQRRQPHSRPVESNRSIRPPTPLHHTHKPHRRRQLPDPGKDTVRLATRLEPGAGDGDLDARDGEDGRLLRWRRRGVCIRA